MGALHGPALLPWAPSSPISPLPAPILQLRQTKNHPQTRASPTVGAGGARPRRPVPPAVTGSCKVRERRRRLQPPGRRVAPGAAVRRERALPTCGGGCAGRGARGRPRPHPTSPRAPGREARARRNPLRPGALAHRLDESLPRGRERNRRELFALPAGQCVPLANFE